MLAPKHPGIQGLGYNTSDEYSLGPQLDQKALQKQTKPLLDLKLSRGAVTLAVLEIQGLGNRSPVTSPPCAG